MQTPRPTPTAWKQCFAAYDAINAGDAEGAMAYYASDAVSVALPAPPGTTGVMVGYDDILQVTKDPSLVKLEITDFHTFGDSAAMTALHSDDAFIALGGTVGVHRDKPPFRMD